MTRKTAIIIGAGPAGLTAAYELLERTDIKPIIFESTSDIGGISKTVNYKGNRMDIGGHRFFSKSDRVMDWWNNIFPIQNAPSKYDLISNNGFDGKAFKKTSKSGKSTVGSGGSNINNSNNNPDKKDKLMLIRKRVSRIFFLRKFFDYPVSLSKDTIMNLGFVRIIKIGASYIKIRIFPIRNEKSLEDFFINRFGKELYLTFFKDYTEKVWGIPCSMIKKEWGAQRIKGLSVTKTIMHAIKSILKKDKSISQKDVETSLIEQYLYPKYGPGQLWEEVARRIKEKGGEIHLGCNAIGVNHKNNKVTSIIIKDTKDNKNNSREVSGDYFFSTMPIKDLIAGFNPSAPKDVAHVAERLPYRDFITVGLLLNKLNLKNQTKIKPVTPHLVPDTWIYIQERDVKIGRLQVFNNWSPYMVKDTKKVWVGLEYFCNIGDELWSMSDEQFKKFAISELVKIDIIKSKDVLDSTIVRMPKTYPAYFGSYSKFHIIRNYVNKFDNLFLIGRNGMHKYNNQDHSMLTAMVAVDNIQKNIKTKENIWAVNAEEEYHETKK